VHAASQHTPSVQCPLTQSVFAAQVAPADFWGMHAPALQKFPAEHWAFVVHAARQAVAPHTYGAHALVTDAGHVAFEPVQTATALCVPPVHEAARHWVPGAA